jgi:hypothetical protein
VYIDSAALQQISSAFLAKANRILASLGSQSDGGRPTH